MLTGVNCFITNLSTSKKKGSEAMFMEIVDEKKGKTFESKELYRYASLSRFKAGLAIEYALKKADKAKNCMAITRLRQLQIEARINRLLEEDRQTDL